MCVHGVGFVYVGGGVRVWKAEETLRAICFFFFFDRLQIFFYPFYWPGACGLDETRWPGDLPYLLLQSGDGKQVTLGAFFYVGSGDRTDTFLLGQQALHRWSHLPALLLLV